MKKFISFITERVRLRIFLVFLFAAFTVILTVRLISVYNADTRATDFLVTHTYEIIKDIENVKSSVAESEAAERAFLLTGNEEWKKLLERAHKQTAGALSSALSQVEDAHQKEHLKQLEKIIHQKIIAENAQINDEASLGGNLDRSGYDRQTRIINNDIQLLLDEFMARQSELLKKHSETGSHSKTKAITTAMAGMGLFFVFITATLIRLNNDIRRRKKAENEIRYSEKKYRDLIEHAGVTIFTSNAEGIFTYVSGRAQVLTGFSAEELTGKSFATLVLPSWIETVATQYQQQAKERIPESTIEFPIITKNGQQKWVEQQAVLLFNDDKTFAGFQCVVKDISDKKEADRRLQKSEHLMQSVLDNTREGFFMINRSYKLLLVNKQGRKGLELLSGKQVMTGMNLMDFVVESEKEKALENLARVFNGEQVSYESKYEMPEGPQWIRISHSPVRDKKGTIIGAALVTHDVTEKRDQEEKLRDSDQKIRAMLESTREGFFMIGHDYSIMMMNEIGRENIYAFTGKKAQPGDNILQYILPERKEIFTGTFQRVMNGSTEETEMKVNVAEGEKWFQTNYFPVRNANNEIIAVCSSSKDITEKKLVDNALSKIRAEREEYQYRLQSILDNAPLIVFVKDLDGRYLFVNKAFLELLNLRNEEVIGKTDFDITSAELATRYKKVDDEVIRSLRSIENEETINSGTGGRHLLLTKFPLFDRNNNIYGVSGIAADYTDKVQYRQKLITAKKKAEQAELLQEQFLANMSHEIRTPMNGIIGMTNILMGTALHEEQKEFVNIIRQSSDNLLFLINDILDLSKIKSGKLALEQIQFNLKEALDTALAPFAIKTKEKGIELVSKLDTAVPQQLTGDPYRLNQIINNLLSNAVKFTEKGTITLDVKLEKDAGNHALIQFSVSDSGIGIPEGKLSSIFNSFEQASDSTTRKFGGTGLGLAITKQLIELQAGKIDVASTMNEGTTFTATIPYVYTKIGQVKEARQTAAQQDNSALKGKRILVAEDNEINQKVIGHILKKVGIETVIGNNGREAVNHLEAGQAFDLVILDLQMPEMDGYQTATYIRKKLQLNIPIIAMTASALRNEKMKCFELGMNEYMSKPFSPSELFQQLKRFLVEQPAASPDKLKQTQTSETSLYNLSLLHDMDDNDHFCEVLQLFLETTPVSLKEIKEAVLYENWATVHKKAHKMKSSLGILQMNSIMQLVNAVEQSAKQEKETEKIPGWLNEAIELFELVRPIIETELNNAKAINV